MAKDKTDKLTTDNTPEPEFKAGPSTARQQYKIAGTIYYEVDTGDRYRLTRDGTWELIDNVNT